MWKLVRRDASLRVQSIALVAALAGCQQADSVAATQGARAPEAVVPSQGAVPAIRVKLLLEELGDARNRAQDHYRETVAICQAANLTVKALSPDEVARLGTAEIEILVDAQRRLSRQTTWHWSSPSAPDALCQFTFEERVAERYRDATTTGWSGDASGPGWQEVPAEADAMQIFPVDAQEERSVAEATGWRALGASAKAGQTCERWQNQREEACMWSGGAQAGFSSAPPEYVGCFAASFERFEAAIPLHVEPLDGTGCRIRVESISIGSGSLPANDMVPRTRGRIS